MVAQDGRVELRDEDSRVVPDGVVADDVVVLQGRELGGVTDDLTDDGDVVTLSGETRGIEVFAQEGEFVQRVCGADELGGEEVRRVIDYLPVGGKRDVSTVVENGELSWSGASAAVRMEVREETHHLQRHELQHSQDHLRLRERQKRGCREERLLTRKPGESIGTSS